MKKIMFNDKFGLTEAVLNGKKTMTRRIVSEKLLERWSDYDAFCNSVCTEGIITERQYYNEINFYLDNSKYKIGEVVAVAQSYKNANVRYLPEEDEEFGCYNFPADQTKGWDNKMFVRADLMPHQIQITDISIQELRDISDEDVIKEGFSLEPINDNNGSYAFHHEYMLTYLDKMGLSKEIRDRSAKDAYSLLIDKIYPNLLWENPYVFTYDFKLIK